MAEPSPVFVSFDVLGSPAARLSASDSMVHLILQCSKIDLTLTRSAKRWRVPTT